MFILSLTDRVPVSCSNPIYSRILTSSIVKTTDSAMLKLFCYVLGEGCNNTFVVNIKEDETVADLKKAIKEKKSPKFNDILADSLTLWKASVPYSLNLKKEVEALNLVDDDSLQRLRILSDIFSSGLDRSHVHIIVDRPRSGELQPLCLYSIIVNNLVSYQVAVQGYPLPIRLDNTKVRFSNAINYPCSLIIL